MEKHPSRSGKHVVYSVWQRTLSQSPKLFMLVLMLAVHHRVVRLRVAPQEGYLRVEARLEALVLPLNTRWALVTLQAN